MEDKKVLIIEDLIDTQKQLSQYYDKENIQYELCKSFLSTYEKITEIIKKDKLGEYEYILMDGELNGYYTDKLIEQLLQEKSVPPIISISGITKQAEAYHLPYADKFGIIENLKFILGKSDEVIIQSQLGIMEEYKERFDKREEHTTTRKELLEVLNPKKTEEEEKVAIQHTEEKTPFFKRLTQIFSKKQS